MVNNQSESHLKVDDISTHASMCRDIIANSNITKGFIVNPCDSCNTDVNTSLNAIRTCTIIWRFLLITYVYN